MYQDTFLKTLELLDKIQKDGNPKSYLLSVAIRIWKNRNRKINRRNSIAPMESEEPMEPAAGGNGERSEVEDHLLKKEEIRYVQTTLRKLPEKYRIPLCLYYGEELTIEDIAGCLRIPQGTVKSRYLPADSRGTGTICAGGNSRSGGKIAHKSFEELMKDAMADEQNSVTELETVDGIRVYYEGYARKYVPDGYQLTPYDQTSIAAGKYEIVYGAESQYMKCISRVMLEMDGLVYCINYRGVYPNWDKYGAEGLGQMAAEIIRAGE